MEGKSVFIVCLIVFCIGLIVGIILTAAIRKIFQKQTEIKSTDFLQKEANLEKISAIDLITNSVRADELCEQSASLAELARKRIRNKSREALQR